MCSSNGYLRSGKCAIGHSGTGKSSFVDHLVCEQALAPSRDKQPPVTNVYLKIIFLISQPKIYVVGTQKNRLNETVLLSTQNIY